MQETTSMVIEQPDGQGAKPNRPVPVVLWDKTDRFAPEGLAEVDLAPLPLDLPVLRTRRTVTPGSYSGADTRRG